MNNSQQFERSSQGNDFEEAFLMRHDMYIRFLVIKRFPHHLFHAEVLDMEIDELVQKVRIKLWRVLKRQPITNPNALIMRIVRSVIVDMVRRYKPVHSLYMDGDGESDQGHLLMTSDEGLHDPAYEFEQKEIDIELAALIIQAIQRLPSHQRYSVTCALNDHLDSIRPFVTIFKAYGIDIEATHWPDSRAEMQSLKTSLSVSRKKLHLQLGR